MNVERITMMEWFDAPTPTGRSRSFRYLGLDRCDGLVAIGMVGEKQMSLLLQKLKETK